MMNPSAKSAEVATHAAAVKDFFEAPQGYLGRREFDIRIRTMTVAEMTAGQQPQNILDVGCGNGSVSIPLLADDPNQTLTLLDVSANMLSLARRKVAERHVGKVAFVNDDVLTHEFPQAFDLIICLGVLAHVESPSMLVERLSRLLAPNGLLILEMTDGFHPVGRLLRLYHWLLGLVRPIAYSLNTLRFTDIRSSCESNGLALNHAYRYSLPPPGSQRLFSHDTLFRMTRGLFGSSDDNKRAWLGNIAIAAFRKRTNALPGR